MKRPPSRSVVSAADRPVSPRAAAVVVGAIAIVVAAGGHPIADALFDTTTSEPHALAALRRAADRPADLEARRGAGVRSVIAIVVDGLRVDESRRMAAVEALRRRGVHGELGLHLPSLSRPFYHSFLVGVPQNGTGVRTNRFVGRARLDSLADRVRAGRGIVAFVAEGLDWFVTLCGRPDDACASGNDSLGAPLARILSQTALRPGPALTIVHVLAVDESAHDNGIRSPAHARALELANRVVADATATMDRARAAGVPIALLVLSDHGHIAVGGHGGDEPEVMRSPLVLVAPGLAPRRVRRPFLPCEMAPTIAAWLGVDPPRSAVCDPAAELLRPDLPARLSRAARTRAVTLERATQVEMASLGARRTWLVALVLLLAVCALGAIKRAFSGLDAASLAGSVGLVALCALAHVAIAGRPFTLSAVDKIGRHGPRLAMLGALAAVVAIALGALLARRAVMRIRLYRAGAAVLLTTVTAMALSIAWIGGAMGPWPLGAFAYYAPILTHGMGTGSAAVSALVLLGTAAFLGGTARPRAQPKSTEAVEK